MVFARLVQPLKGVKVGQVQAPFSLVSGRFFSRVNNGGIFSVFSNMNGEYELEQLKELLKQELKKGSPAQGQVCSVWNIPSYPLILLSSYPLIILSSYPLILLSPYSLIPLSSYHLILLYPYPLTITLTAVTNHDLHILNHKHPIRTLVPRVYSKAAVSAPSRSRGVHRQGVGFEEVPDA